jgi:hypothetical protein
MRTQMNHKQERDIERRIQEIHHKANERLLTLVCCHNHIQSEEWE